MKRDKRAVSAIVATVLIIGITVGIIALVGNFLAGMVRDNLQGGTACSTAALQISIKTEGYTCYSDGGTIEVAVFNADGSPALDENDKPIYANEEVDGGTLNVQVAYGSENVSLVGIYVLPKVGGSDLGKLLVNESLPDTGLTKVISVNVTEKPDEVAIMPIVSVGNSEKECSPTEYVTVLNC